jgi:choline dehydrogenase-like flavoprotein
MITRDEYVAKLKTQLERWSADMATWESRAKAAQADAKVRYEQELKQLREQREKALYNLKLLEGASATAWSEFTRGADEAWDRMREAIAKARTHFEKK